MIVRLFFFYIFLFQLQIKQINCEIVNGCTINNNNNNNNRRSVSSNKTSITLSCSNNGYILVRNLTFGVHKTASQTCSYQPGDCTTRTTYIGMECNGLRNCNLDLNPQYLHICSQYSDYMVLDYSCLQGQSLSVCDNDLILTSSINMNHRLFIRSPNYPHEYENSLNCSCKIDTNKSIIEFLDFYLEERDEMNLCSRDYLQIENRTYCDSKLEQNNQLISSFIHNSSIHLIFKTNDVITRKGFWLMIYSEQSIKVSCKNSFESSYPITSSLKTIIHSISLPSNSLISMTNSSRLHLTRRYTLSFILILIIIFVIVLLLLNLLLVILCWKQRISKASINSKTSSTHRPFFCSKRLSTSSCSSITYGDTPVFTSLDTQKQQTTSTTTTATGTYEDPNELLTLQRQQKFEHNQSLYIQHSHEPKTFCPIVLPSCSINAGYNRMIHFSSAPIHCHFNSSAQTFYPLHSHNPLDSQHIYETIQDGQCPYQRLAATIRRQQQKQQQCTCCCTYNEQQISTRTDDHDKNVNIELNPETLV
ncbi:unnamed protein product [Rotaria sp. Silwood2]|nr:unnamed protein product [Rotaria sp. Silwood2]CAF3088727.1 unnamed protein product [Rotaria sp. Silwood2]CAF4101809.1 unnamed protein product [Rotaria sp. Silwood2]CAF4210051.1 unnamed protein product [Rotaria sp. Silwood2]